MSTLRVMGGGNSWDDALSGFAAWCSSSGTSPATVRLRLSYLNRFAAAQPAPFDASLDELVAFVGAPAWSPETRKSARAALRAFYRWACETGRLDVDPSARLRPVRVPPARPRPAPDWVLANAMVRADPRQQLMLLAAAHAGLRCAEIARMHTDDVEDGRLRVTGKGGRVRLVPLHPSIERRLPPGPGWVFPSPLGGHLRADSVSAILRRVLPPGYTGHMLRHRFATRAYAATRDLRAVQELLGHSKPETTARYTQVPDDSLREAVWAAAS